MRESNDGFRAALRGVSLGLAFKRGIYRARARRSLPRSWTLLALITVCSLALSTACAGPAVEPTRAPAETKPTATTAKPAPTSAPAAQATPSAKATEPAKTPPKEAAKDVVKPLDPPVAVKFSTMKIVADAGLFIAMERGYFKEEGINIELVQVRSAADVVAPLAIGELDFGAGVINPAYFNAVGRGLDLKIVADKVTWAYGKAGAAFIVRKDLWDGGLKDASKLKGKTLALNLRANPTEMYADLALRKVGLSIDDVNVVELAFPDMLAALANKAIDAAYEIEPFILNSLEKGLAEVLLNPYELYPGEIAVATIVSPVFAKKNPEAAKRVVTAHLRGQRDYFQAFVKGTADKGSIATILAKYTGTAPATLNKIRMHAVLPNGTVDPNILIKDQEYFFQRGWVKEKVDVDKLVDTQYIDYALRRLGKWDETGR